MFFIGVFSTHITYIILALIYIFGYGSYALKFKKQTNEDNADFKTITYQKTANSVSETTCFFTEKNCNSYKKTQTSKVDINNYNICFICKRLKAFDCKTWTSYNYQLPDITRPSPLNT